jgi:hypothetical protein
MKKRLFGTSALVAMGLAAQSASAASALQLGMTGFYRGAAGLVIGGKSAGPFTTASGGTGGAAPEPASGRRSGSTSPARPRWTTA